MKSIYLLRHAKSSWDDPAEADFDRPLAKRGLKAAAAMAEHFLRSDIRPALILCSPARRTRQTAELLGLGEPLYDPRLYEASGLGLLACLKAVARETPSVLLIGHNPGLRNLALLLAKAKPGSAAWDRLAEKLPTGALVCLGADIDDWRNLAMGRCSLDGLVRPKDLADLAAP